jgi:hypothetical protein
VAVVADGCKILALSVIKFEDFDAISCEKPVNVLRTRPGLLSAVQLVRGGEYQTLTAGAGVLYFGG